MAVLSTGEVQVLQKQVADLEIEVVALTAENDLLRSELGPAAWRIDANIAEAFVHEFVGGRRTTGSAPYDIIAANGDKIEVKFSGLNRVRGGSSMRRWVWARILGRAEAKEFDRLILVAPHDPRFRRQGVDPESRWMIFDVPAPEVRSLIETDGTIWAGTHPKKFLRPTHLRLIRGYQSSRQQLISRYRVTL